ncbi:hypothetical protein Vretifemale_16387, partial [Volvox reticuliferus]
ATTLASLTPSWKQYSRVSYTLSAARLAASLFHSLSQVLPAAPMVGGFGFGDVVRKDRLGGLTLIFHRGKEESMRERDERDNAATPYTGLTRQAHNKDYYAS